MFHGYAEEVELIKLGQLKGWNMDDILDSKKAPDILPLQENYGTLWGVFQGDWPCDNRSAMYKALNKKVLLLQVH